MSCCKKSGASKTQKTFFFRTRKRGITLKARINGNRTKNRLKITAQKRRSNLKHTTMPTHNHVKWPLDCGLTFKQLCNSHTISTLWASSRTTALQNKHKATGSGLQTASKLAPHSDALPLSTPMRLQGRVQEKARPPTVSTDLANEKA